MFIVSAKMYETYRNISCDISPCYEKACPEQISVNLNDKSTERLQENEEVSTQRNSCNESEIKM